MATILPQSGASIAAQAQRILDDVLRVNLKHDTPETLPQTIEDLQNKARAIVQLQSQITNNPNAETAATIALALQTIGTLQTSDETREILTHAAEIRAIRTDIQTLYNGGPSTSGITLESLQTRVGILSSNRNLSQGNRNALNDLGEMIETPAAPRPAAAPARLSPPSSTNQLAANRAIVASQDIEFEEALRVSREAEATAARVAREEASMTAFEERNRALQMQLQAGNNQPVPTVVFPAVIEFYTQLRRQPEYTSLDVRHRMNTLRVGVEVILMSVIGLQEESERAAAEAIQMRAEQANAPGLPRLKAALEQSSEVQTGEQKTAIQTAYGALAPEEKTRLLGSLNTLLEPTLGRKLPPGIINAQFHHLPGTRAQKIAAIQNILPPPVQTPQPIDRVAERMRIALEAARSIRPTPPAVSEVTPARAQQTPAPAAVSTSSGGYLASSASSSGTPARAQQTPAPAAAVFHVYDAEAFDSEAMRSIKSLQKLLPLLQDNASHAQFDEALALIAAMESVEIQHSAHRRLVDSLCFHLFLMHRSERSPLPPGNHYGNNALVGVHQTSHLDRRRAIERTIAQLALEALETAVNRADGAEIVAMLQVLERANLPQRDLPEGQANIAQNLFWQMYSQHNTARATNSSLIDPHNAMFEGDFGRTAFKSSAPGIDPAVKLAAIRETIRALNAAWKM